MAQSVMENYFFLMVNTSSDTKPNKPSDDPAAGQTCKRKRCDEEGAGSIRFPQLAQQ